MDSRRYARQRSKVKLFAEIIFNIGLLIAVAGATKFAFNSGGTEKVFPTNIGSSTERRLAISESLKNGDNTYAFVTHFIPGIGTIPSPHDYLEAWKSRVTTNY